MTEWREGTAEGSFRTIVRNPGEEVGNTDTKGVMELCHMIMAHGNLQSSGMTHNFR